MLIMLITYITCLFFSQVWELSDIDKDGSLDRDEFSVVSSTLSFHKRLH